jgi:hypothetical protein
MRKLSFLLVLLPFASIGCKDSGSCEPGLGQCAADEYCDPDTKQCTLINCDHAANCANRCCGDDNCGTGTDCEDNCGNGEVCNTITCTCTACTPECGSRLCGPDPVCGASCGICEINSTCSQFGNCECLFVECNGTCCASGQFCNGLTYQCENILLPDGGDGSDGGVDDGDDDLPPDGGPDAADQQNGDEPLPDGGPDAGDTGDQGGPVIQGLGSPCTCEGPECEQMGFPDPTGGPIIGCDDVPTNIPGAELACMRTYQSDIANTFFANGYCSLIATQCTAMPMVCDALIFGDYDNMTSCPAGSVMITDIQLFVIMEFEVPIPTKNCAASCQSSNECREEEVDPVLGNEPTQYDCLDYDGVKFCYDPRNLSGEYTATQF